MNRILKTFAALTLVTLGAVHCSSPSGQSEERGSVKTAQALQVANHEIVILGTNADGSPREFQKNATMWSAEFTAAEDPETFGGTGYYTIEGYWWDAAAGPFGENQDEYGDYALIDVYFTAKPTAAGSYTIAPYGTESLGATSAAIYVYLPRVDSGTDWKDWSSTQATAGTVEVVDVGGELHVKLDGIRFGGESGPISASANLTMPTVLNYPLPPPAEPPPPEGM